MKRILLSFALASAPLLHAQTPFTYQGRLENSGTAFTGTVHIRLSLYSALTGGSALRTETLPNVPVTNGIFTITPATFTASDFPGASRFLNIEVSSDSGANYTALTPRQQVTWAPYAMTAGIVTGGVPASQITGTLNPSVIGNGTTSAAVTFGNGGATFSSLVGTPPFSVSNATKVLNLNSDLFDGLDSTAFLQKSGGTMTGPLGIANGTTLNFGNQARQMINLYNLDYAIGIQTNTLYQRSFNDWSWHRGGDHSDAQNAPGNGGTEIMRLSGSDLWLRPNAISGPRGRVVFGDLVSGNPRVSIGEPQGVADADELELTGSKIRVVNPFTNGIPAITFGQTTGQHIILYEGGGDTYGIGVQSGTQYFRTGEQFAWFRDGIHVDTANHPGSGGSMVMTLSGTGTLTARGTESGFNVINRNNSAQEWALYSRNSGGTGQFAIWNNGTGDVAAFSPNGDMYLTGQVSATVLTVRGGADVAEPFEMTKPEEMEPGTVVIIDEENAGHLKESTASYDTRVAGIISGAGGVKPGLRLHQEGVMEGDHHVALSGRVYVKADASFGKIKPGDLLTTSSNPGYAMKVNDHTKAQGAILGKAMSRLDHDTGLVLVLVTLQ
jgi:hypothetical protein